MQYAYGQCKKTQVHGLVKFFLSPNPCSMSTDNVKKKHKSMDVKFILSPKTFAFSQRLHRLSSHGSGPSFADRASGDA